MARKSYNYMTYSQLRSEPHQAAPLPKVRKRRTGRKLLGLLVLAVLVLAGFALYNSQHNTKAVADAAITHTAKSTAKKPATGSSQQNQSAATSASAEAAEGAAQCAQNTAGGQLALVSISKRHMWACNGTTMAYDSPVVTGIEYLAADLTPVGTYHIYGKYTNTVLRGSDSTGSWDDPVSYWMPWLHNQYGSYGFHDATWRAPTDFGNIDPNSADASHGCVELPLATAAWLYNWAQIGTTVTIES